MKQVQLGIRPAMSVPHPRPSRGLSCGRTALAALAALAAMSIALTTGCNATREPSIASNPSIVNPPEGSGLQPVSLPDLAGMEAPAREQMQARISALRASVTASSAPRDNVGEAYGEMGKLFMAATYLDAAESCFLNAQILAPDDARWPYYLGHVYKVKGPLAKSVASFERALQLKPDDMAALVWLGEAHLSQGEAETAGPFFAQALALQPESAAARVGAGRVALAQKDHAGAAKLLEEALQREPGATAIHYPLAMAYRGLGDLAKAEAHLARQGDLEARPPDPLMRDLDVLLQSPEAYNVRGGRELEARNWAAAAENFRKGLALAPDDASLRHRLGTALAQMGDVRGAAEQFERVLATTPGHARAHFSLGVLLNDSRRYAEASDHFSSALKYEPGYVQARVQLAGVLARSGRPGEALAHYRQAIDANPTLTDAAFGYAMTLIRLRRYADARDRLTESMKRFPDQPMFSHALARLLVAAPDDRVRDGARGKTLVDALIKGPQTFELGETTAMMLAELGHFEQAAAVQRDVLKGASDAGILPVVRRATENLKLYERRQPCRTPFTEDEFP
jgi:tetratricopeptide (TPR) repeat protein